MNDPKTKSIIGWCLSLSIYLSIFVSFLLTHFTHSLTLYVYMDMDMDGCQRDLHSSAIGSYIYIYIFCFRVELRAAPPSVLQLQLHGVLFSHARNEGERTHTVLSTQIYIYIYIFGSWVLICTLAGNSIVYITST